MGFDRFATEIRRHIVEEEEELLPIFEERGGKIHGGDPDLFRAEHRKIEGFLDEIHPVLAEIRSGQHRAIIELLEREYMLKQLLLHHDLRERNILYPTLDRITDDGEKKRIVRDTPSDQ